jgi:hypothetical protein
MEFKKNVITFLLLFFLSSSFLSAFQIGRLKYKGGGDWYNDPDTIPNFARFLKRYTHITIEPVQKIVELEDDSIFSTPFVYVTGHGNIKFSASERKKLLKFLRKGGFMYVDDDYGMDKYFRKEMESIFGKGCLKELPRDFELFNIYFDFTKKGIPKVHNHYPKKPPQVFGIWLDGRCVIIYTYNCNISDGWTKAHKDPEPLRIEALKFGVNIFMYFLLH